MNPLLTVFINDKEKWIPLIRYYTEPNYKEIFQILKIIPNIRIEIKLNDKIEYIDLNLK